MLKKIDILADDGHVTVAGLLLFGMQPQRYFQKSTISYVHFSGSEMDADLLDRKNIEGTLDPQIDSALVVIKTIFVKLPPFMVQSGKY